VAHAGLARTEESKDDFDVVAATDGEGNVANEIERLRNEVVGGLLYTHTRSNANTNRLLEAASFLYALVELLSERGLVEVKELDARKQEVAKRLLDRFLDKGMGVALQEGEQDKYKFTETVEIDCENRVHLCKAACCKMSFALSQKDVEEGVIKWDLGRPYLIAQSADGYCRHLDRETKRCTVREHRPLPCRGYDCRKDKRIWLDFDKKIVNPKLEEQFANSQLGTNGSR
jgi:Fe-S-cluster containining protein